MTVWGPLVSVKASLPQVIVTGQAENGQLYVIPSTHFGGAQVLLPQGQLMDVGETAGTNHSGPLPL